MRRIFFLIFLFFFFPFFCAKQKIFAQEKPLLATNLPTASSKLEEIVVVFNGPPSSQTILSFSLENPFLEAVGNLAGENSLIFKLKSGNLEEAIQRLKSRADIKSVFPNYKLKIFALTNDPAIMATPMPGKPRLQWNLFNLKIAGEGKTAWDISSGSPNVVVAVIDSGVHASHPDLAGKIASLVECLSSSCREVSSMTDNSSFPHGTHVAGIVAAATNNNLGVASVGYQTKVMVIKVTNEAGEIEIADLINAIKWAADHGARVINMSLGQYEENLDSDSLKTMSEAVSYAWGKGAVLVAAAGNCGAATAGRRDCAIVDGNGTVKGYVTNSKGYPGALPNVISVAALKVDNSLASYSQRNDSSNPKVGNWISVAAPGGECGSENDAPNCILSTFYSSQGQFGYMAGTSQATAHVSGLAALILAVNPSLQNFQVKEIIERTANRSVATGVTNYGMVDALAALNAAKEANNITSSPSPTPFSVTPSPFSTLTPTPLATPLVRLPKTLPSPYPPGPYCPSFSTCPEKSKGDADCNAKIEEKDYEVWKKQFDFMVLPQQELENANFFCKEGDSSTYFVDLVDFEVWRRNVKN